MPNVLERLRNVFTDELPDIRQFQAERVAGRNDVLTEVSAELEINRAAIRQDWVKEAQERRIPARELFPEFQQRIEDHNRVVYSLYEMGRNSEVELPELIHPEGLQTRIDHALQQRQLQFEPQVSGQTRPLSAEFDGSKRREITQDQGLEIGV